MPLTVFQKNLAKLLSTTRSQDSYLAGGAALHSRPNSLRYSQDLDYFQDSENRVATAFASDQELLKKNNYLCSIEIHQPGYIRAIVTKKGESTKVEWAFDSAWRFLPVVADVDLGFVLDPVDLAINKLLALAGRDEPRDFLDVIYTHETILPLPCQVWAACGKDPGFNPISLLELLKRRGRYHSEDFERLNLNVKIDLQSYKSKWLVLLSEIEVFIKRAPAKEVGCLYYSKKQNKFVLPNFENQSDDISPHYGQLYGVFPQINSSN